MPGSADTGNTGTLIAGCICIHYVIYDSEKKTVIVLDSSHNGIRFRDGNGKAAITGDFVLLAQEVNPVIGALEKNGIEVTAVHSHMLTESPRLFYLHFWANDDALKLAHGLRAALDKTNSAPPPPQR